MFQPSRSKELRSKRSRDSCCWKPAVTPHILEPRMVSAPIWKPRQSLSMPRLLVVVVPNAVIVRVCATSWPPTWAWAHISQPSPRVGSAAQLESRTSCMRACHTSEVSFQKVWPAAAARPASNVSMSGEPTSAKVFVVGLNCMVNCTNPVSSRPPASMKAVDGGAPEATTTGRVSPNVPALVPTRTTLTVVTPAPVPTCSWSVVPAPRLMSAVRGEAPVPVKVGPCRAWMSPAWPLLWLTLPAVLNASRPVKVMVVAVDVPGATFSVPPAVLLKVSVPVPKSMLAPALKAPPLFTVSLPAPKLEAATPLKVPVLVKVSFCAVRDRAPVITPVALLVTVAAPAPPAVMAKPVAVFSGRIVPELVIVDPVAEVMFTPFTPSTVEPAPTVTEPVVPPATRMPWPLVECTVPAVVVTAADPPEVARAALEPAPVPVTLTEPTLTATGPAVLPPTTPSVPAPLTVVVPEAVVLTPATPEP